MRFSKFLLLTIFIPALAFAQNVQFPTNLKRGSTGQDVSRLQEFLKTVPDVYPGGLVTGYFGALTEKAVKLFQAKYGIEQVGFVGPKTRAKLNGLISPAISKPMEIVRQQPTVALAEQFAALEKELSEVKASGFYLSPTHYDRIKTDLAALESVGYSVSEIERLRGLALKFSPHLQDQQKTTTAQPLSVPCVSNQNPTFSAHITDTSKVSYIVPPPTMGAGPSLKPHSYIGTNGVNVPVYAPTAMTLKSGSHYVGGPYTFEFQVSCEVTVRFGHITNPVDSIKKLLPSEPKSDSRTQELAPVSFAAGDLIAYTTGTNVAGNWDFGVYNSMVRNRYADDPSWSNSTTYTTAVCPFAYFAPNLKAEYAAKFNSTILGGNPPHGESFCL